MRGYPIGSLYHKKFGSEHCLVGLLEMLWPEEGKGSL